MIVHLIAVLALAVACALWVVIQRASGRDAGRPCSGAGTCTRAPGEECPRKTGAGGHCSSSDAESSDVDEPGSPGIIRIDRRGVPRRGQDG